MTEAKMSWIAALLLVLSLHQAVQGRVMDRGLNLPPTQGTTKDGAFFPGLYQYDYEPTQIARAFGEAGFTAVRLGINVETANNATALQRMKHYIDAAGGRGLVCMFDTASVPGAPWPRTAKVEDMAGMVQAWRKIHAVFAPYGENVRYEIFNEPMGYKSDAAWYLRDMLQVIGHAELPPDRCVLAGLYGSADVLSVARAGWSGYMALHYYSFYLPVGQRSPELFSERIQQAMQGVSSKIFITEFGTGLDDMKVDVDEDEVGWDVARHVDGRTYLGDWQNEHQRSQEEMRSMCESHPKHIWCRYHKSEEVAADRISRGQVGSVRSTAVLAQARAQAEARSTPQDQADSLSFLRGLRDALRTLQQGGAGVMGLYHWHGWHNGDSWDFWDAHNAQTSRFIQLIMSDLTENDLTERHDRAEEMESAWSIDFIHDDQQVNMKLLKDKGPIPSAACPAACSKPTCMRGNVLQRGGKHMTAGRCSHLCSKPYNGMRYCGAGAQYEEAGAVDCSACALPLICGGLPCWSASSHASSLNAGAGHWAKSQQSLQLGSKRSPSLRAFRRHDR